MPLPGWRRLPGTAERYRNPAGREVSRRQYENVRARRHGFTTWSEYQRTAASDEYRRLAARAKERGEKTGVASPIAQHAAEVHRLRARARAGDSDASDKLRDPSGPLAQMLIDAGLRQPEWEWDVGDTPGET